MNKLVILLLLLIANPAFSSDFSKGADAHQKGDFENAIKWYTLAAERGHHDAKLGIIRAQNDLAGAAFSSDFSKGTDAYQKGDFESAIKWYTLSAEKGLIPAQYKLGVLFEEGKVIPRDSAAAIKWYTLAAERGHQDAKQGIIRAQNYLAAALDKNIGAVVKIKSNTMGGDDSPKLNAPASELAVTDDKSSSSSSFGIWTLFGIIAGSVYFMVESKRHQREELRRREEREELHKRLIPLIDIHRVALDRNLNKSIIKNDYGKIVADNRNRAQSEFFASTNLDPAVLGFEDTCDIVLRRLSDLKSQELKIGFDPYNLPTNGYDFEEWVADALIKFGWSAETTSGSGDQGLDVIAKKDGRTLGVQCKLYNAAVGNKAVQEAHSGKIYYGVDAVCVLSNTSYTKSARELAIATEVKLFSVEDIPYIFEKAFAKYA